MPRNEWTLLFVFSFYHRLLRSAHNFRIRSVAGRRFLPLAKEQSSSSSSVSGVSMCSVYYYDYDLCFDWKRRCDFPFPPISLLLFFLVGAGFLIQMAGTFIGASWDLWFWQTVGAEYPPMLLLLLNLLNVRLFLCWWWCTWCCAWAAVLDGWLVFISRSLLICISVRLCQRSDTCTNHIEGINIKFSNTPCWTCSIFGTVRGKSTKRGGVEHWTGDEQNRTEAAKAGRQAVETDYECWLVICVYF